ncbi:hypothetical protein PSE10A_46300 [Pseudomonas amygdali pv. eriobotryae]|uniref:Uncharacterized protein n=1 Tax=Pseudomonas amygdali pv. eriobotryae TaxID=129137 RepID=A0A9P3EEK3_PSEA0|nr:hypothetical protein [Pseudomonas amygdali]GFZ62119.1 hypothetical protein PSE10A_46300 [Pseudomonas amygdali pv. eriobotryae]
MEGIKQSITIMTDIIEQTVTQEKSNKDKLIELDLSLAKAKKAVDNIESKIKNAKAEIGRLADLKLDGKATDNQQILWKKKKDYRTNLEVSKKAKERVVNNLITEITKLTHEAKKDKKVLDADDQEATFKVPVSDVTKVVLYLLKVTNTQSLKELAEDVAKKFSSFQ